MENNRGYIAKFRKLQLERHDIDLSDACATLEAENAELSRRRTDAYAEQPPVKFNIPRDSESYSHSGLPLLLAAYIYTRGRVLERTLQGQAAAEQIG